MKKIIIMFLSVCMLLCITACNQNSCSSNSAKETENITIDENYTETLKLINEKEYEKAYKKIIDIKDKKVAEEIKSKFIVIEDVLLSKQLIIPDDNLGNKNGPYTIHYNYNKNGNIIEIDAREICGLSVGNIVNPFLKHVVMVNYAPCFEKLSYDDNGNLIEITGYDKSIEKVMYKATFLYKDEQNYKVEYVFDGVKEFFGLENIPTYFEYDNNNRLVKAKSEKNINWGVVYIKYDANGNQIEEGTIYNEKGKVIESQFVFGTNELKSKCIWNYGDYYIYNE